MNNIEMLYQNNKKVFILSCLVGSAFLFNSICLLMNIIAPSIAGFGKIFITIILLTGMIMCFPRIRIAKNVIILNVFLLVLILASYFYYGCAAEISVLLQNYIVWGLGVTIIMMQKYDLKVVLDFCFYVSTATIICELLTNAHVAYEPMTWTYSIFPCVASVVVHFLYCRFDGIVKKIFYIPGLIMLIKFIAFSNRGGIVSLAVLLYLVSIKTINTKDLKLRNKTMLNIILLIILICIVVFYEQIIGFLFDIANSNGYKISSLNKMYRLIQEGNITNNRSELYEYAINGFKASPLWGKGIGAFSVNHGGWTHNFVLQILYEGGLLLFAAIIIPLIRIVFLFLKGTNIDAYRYSFFVLLFCTSIPRLLFSTELWNTQAFWMLLAFGLI